MLAVVAPGQGAQTPGFLKPWIAESSFAERLAWLSAVSSLDLEHYGTDADADTIRDTAVAQPLLVSAGLLAALELFPHPADAFTQIGVAAGHSVGELTAAAGVGVLTAEQAMVLVRERGRAMAEASAATPASMTAVVGGDPAEVLAKIEEHGLTAANNNGRGQVVAAGTTDRLAALAADPPARARLIELSVAGAFHTEYMAPAVSHLDRLSRAISTHDPRTRLLSNADGQVVHDGAEVLRRIVRQVSSPVRWDLCMATMADLGVTGLLEMPPAGTLTGIAKRNLKGVEVFALNNPDQLPDASEFVRKHADTGNSAPIASNPTWRLIVSPGKGQFTRTDDLPAGTVLPDLSTVGAVKNLRDEIPVTAPHGGIVVEWLAEDGDPVSPGQPLLRLHPMVETTDATEIGR
ncbi:acyltransferase domain-containing protein [Microlunatus sp. Gsoil 973]|uniref:acyltransferase domain-containing protein n=1 Tax=Microlunatus sp. Gsoil 973 TaxID=2672569 RepID=UPI0012B4753F|nr:acyltransferase domain-containing protein [Microlunatus sp. Gsoil 973]QGN31865.1 acyltransferase domain-containing protein [Microlunatus sp. Gsoil 973]